MSQKRITDSEITDQRHSAGHYHVEFLHPETEDPDDSRYVNDSFEKVKEAIARCTDEIACLGFICTWGCGVTHPLDCEELKQLKVLKTKYGYARDRSGD